MRIHNPKKPHNIDLSGAWNATSLAISGLQTI
jgi:hypothetical protein